MRGARFVYVGFSFAQGPVRGASTKISVLVVTLVCLHIEDLHSFLAGRVAEMDDLVAFRPRLAFGVLDFQHAEVIVTAIVDIFIIGRDGRLFLCYK